MTNKVKYEQNYKPYRMAQWPISNTYPSINKNGKPGDYYYYYFR